MRETLVLGTVVWSPESLQGVSTKGGINDVSNLSGLGYIFAVLIWKENTFTQEMVAVCATCLLSKWAGTTRAVRSRACPVWCSDVSRFARVSDGNAHNLGIISSA